MRSAGDNDSTAVKGTDDQLAARRAFRAKHPRAPRKGSGPPNSSGVAPIDPSLGTGLIDNIICEPEDVRHPRGETADDVLDLYARDAADRATPRGKAAAGVTPDRLADEELDEIELRLRLEHTQPARQAPVFGPRGTADLGREATQTRTRRHPHGPARTSPGSRPATRPFAVATVVVAAMIACAVVIIAPAGPSHRASSTAQHRAVTATIGSAAAVTPGQLTDAARLRAWVPINAERTTAARTAAKERRARAQAVRRRARRRAKARTAAHVAAHRAALAARNSPAPISATSEPQPTADGGSTSAGTSSHSDQPAHSAAAGPTGGIGSMTGGCTPQC